MSTQAVPTTEQTLVERLQDRFRAVSERLGELPAWAVSAMAHLLILFFLAGLTRVTFSEPAQKIIATMDEPDLDQYKFENAVVIDEVGNDSPANIASPSKAAATEVGREPTEQFEQRLTQEFAPPVPAREMIPQPNQMNVAEELDVAGTTEFVGGVEGAVDILTQEIASSLRENKTTVVWMFDASLSLKARRDIIADRFDGIYRQLGQMDGVKDAAKGGALETVAVSYADKWNLLTDEPVTDVKPLVDKIRNIEAPDTALENVFGAISDVTNRFLERRTREHRNMLVFVVTDERGDDANNLEMLITRLKRYGIRVYCVGNASPLGREKGLVRWTYDDGATEMLPVDRGPEVVAPQLVTLPFWGGEREELLSSGYGPYAMTRLCAETGGLYLITEDDMKNFDPGVMRKYPPDYRPASMFEAELRKNVAKQALTQASIASQAAQNDLPMPRTIFPAENDTVLRQAITEAQKPMAVVDYHFAELSGVLEKGERDRDKLDSPRWRASYDLAVGRVLALRARAFGYNAMLADMKVAPKSFKEQGSNQWALKPSAEITSGPAVKKLAESATAALARVIDDHPGTPWAELAMKELATPMGWAWVERNELVARFGPKAKDPEVAKLLLAEEEKKKKEMKPAMKPVQRVKPKL